MEIKLGILLDSQGTLADLNQTRGLKSVTAYRISKNVKAVTEEFKTYEEHRTNLCKKYANKDKDGNPIIKEGGNYDIPEENLEKFLEELKELHEEMVEIPIRKVKLEEIDIGLSPAQMESIEYMLDLEG